MTAAPFDEMRAHRWFAIELNNLVWDLIEADVRSPEDVERMIHAAHASCFHWLQVGNTLNHLRAECLLATAYAKAGLTEPSVRHAERCLALSGDAGEVQTLFDRATAHGCASAAYRLAQRLEESQSQHRLAETFVAQLDDPSERSLFARLYPPD